MHNAPKQAPSKMLKVANEFSFDEQVYPLRVSWKIWIKATMCVLSSTTVMLYCYSI